MSARQQILQLVDTAPTVPLAARPAGWPEGLHLRRPTLSQRDAIARYLTSGEGGQYPDDARAYILVRLVCTADGQRVFADEDATAVGALPADEAYTAITDQVLSLLGAHDPNR